MLTFTCIRLWHYILQIRLNKIVFLIGIILIFLTATIYYYLTKVDTIDEDDIHRTRLQLQALDDYSSSDLKMRIEELLRIKASVGQELRQMEEKRSKLQREITAFQQKIEDVKSELMRQQMEMDRVKISVQQAQVAYQEALQRNTPELAAPLKILAKGPPERVVNKTFQSVCMMAQCWDYSRCSITSGFPVYFYKDVDWEMEGFLSTTMLQVLGYNPHVVRNPDIACAYLVLLGEVRSTSQDPQSLSNYLKALPYWSDGRNHILFYLTRSDITRTVDHFAGVDTGRAIRVQSTFKRNEYRLGFDVVVPPLLGPPGGDVWQLMGAMLPARRRYLASFQGSPPLHNDHKLVVDKLKNFVGTTSDEFLFDFVCPLRSSSNETNEYSLDWGLCGTESMRLSVLKESTFAIIFPPHVDFISSTLLQTRIFEATRAGAIPVILGGDQVHLSFDEVLSWRRAALFLPFSRTTELHFLLRSVSDADLLSLRIRGRTLHTTYLATVQAQFDALIALLRDRCGVPALPVRDEPSPGLFNDTFVPLKTEVLAPESEPEESLGPLEPPYASPVFLRNYTLSLTQSYDVWNVWANPFWLYPHLPFDPVLPSDGKFIGSPLGFRPVGGGAGGAGKEFSEALGGNYPREQFTIVMLNYEREQVLINSISRLYGLPYLNKVIVVWNSPKPASEDTRWPDIGVPVQLIRARRNSLNNRFLPYDAIETEAVLSVDDDAHLRHDEIMFGFRVWREKRDRIVGFPGRFHAWDLNHGGWLYNSNYSCELSMVLTGAAFIHKYYLYLYSYWLPQAIRDKVDEYMNCEDIAINFMVSHFTRQPPVKVTSRWTFRCPGCPVSLSEDDTHFQERHKCIQFFTQVFGYTPLLNTQFRADSILFKTRIPHDKQKCFKFI